MRVAPKFVFAADMTSPVTLAPYHFAQLRQGRAQWLWGNDPNCEARSQLFMLIQQPLTQGIDHQFCNGVDARLAHQAGAVFLNGFFADR